MSTAQATKATDNIAKALSKNSAFNFLKGSKNAATALSVSTPLETASKEVESFALYTTGTLQLSITPEILDAIEELRSLGVTKDFKRLAHFVTELQIDAPSQNGLATTIVNPMWLASHVPFCQTPRDLTDEMVKKSTWAIEFQGEHALIDGVPVWERLDGERLDFYLLYKLYRDSRYGLIDSGDYVLCTRSMAGLARRLDLAPQLLSIISKIYNWSTRCGYYDIFFEHEILKRRQMEVQLLQRDHLSVSMQLLDTAVDWLTENVKHLQPKDALSMAELGLKYSRLSLGLAPDKPIIKDADGKGHSTSLSVQINNAEQMVQMNQASQQSNVERQLGEDLKDNDNLLSILHVLQESGAMATALREEITEMPEEADNFESDDDFIEVPDDSAGAAPIDPTNKFVEIIEPAGFEEEA